MAFCVNCGKELQEGAKFCDGCGTKTAGDSDNATRKQVFVGEIRKCPSCGAQLKSMDIICPECGSELTGKSSAVTNTLSKTADNLGSVKTRKEKLNIVESITIPSNLEEIQEFLIFVDSQLEDINPVSSFLWGYLHFSTWGISYALRGMTGYVSSTRMNTAWMKVLKQIQNKAAFTLKEHPTVKNQLDGFILKTKKRRTIGIIINIMSFFFVIASYIALPKILLASLEKLY